jgi:hypothetical protein
MIPVTAEKWSFAYRCAPTLLIELSVASLAIRRMLGFHQRGEISDSDLQRWIPRIQASTRPE